MHFRSEFDRSPGPNFVQTLREKLEQSSRFLIGTELVSVRGGMSQSSAVKARTFANQLVESADIDWISITDNAGSHVRSPGG